MKLNEEKEKGVLEISTWIGKIDEIAREKRSVEERKDGSVEEP